MQLSASPVVFSAKEERPNSQTMAQWAFQPNATEEDIDVEHRVLMSEFMHRALGRAEQLYHKAGRSQLSAPVEVGLVSRPALLLWRSNGKDPRTPR